MPRENKEMAAFCQKISDKVDVSRSTVGGKKTDRKLEKKARKSRKKAEAGQAEKYF